MDNRGSLPGRREGVFFVTVSASRANQNHIQSLPQALRPDSSADCSPPTIAEVKMHTIIRTFCVKYKHMKAAGIV
jgi:hypothetical protein